MLLTWDAAWDEVSPADAIVYELCVSETRVEKGGCQPFIADDESAAGALEHVVGGLEANTRYFFVVRARDEAGNVDDNLVEATALTPGNHAVKAVTVGGGHACALMARGTVRCWGANDFGQLGDGSTESREVAAPVAGLELVKLIAAGTEHTCAAIADGTVRCWGSNDRGQLGDGTTEDSALPVVVTGLEFVKALAAGDGHTCAIFGDGTMRCWGANDRGQLGDGTFEDSLVPAEVSGATYVKDVACGAEHTCAVEANGIVACWGRGDSGQLGLGDFEDRGVWTPVASPQFVTRVAAGDAHTCVRIGDGTAMCWGANDEGQLGVEGAMDTEALPLVVTDIERVSDVHAGGSHTCVRDGVGTARCWGGSRLGDRCPCRLGQVARCRRRPDLCADGRRTRACRVAGPAGSRRGRQARRRIGRSGWPGLGDDGSITHLFAAHRRYGAVLGPESPEPTRDLVPLPSGQGARHRALAGPRSGVGQRGGRKRELAANLCRPCGRPRPVLGSIVAGGTRDGVGVPAASISCGRTGGCHQSVRRAHFQERVCAAQRWRTDLLGRCHRPAGPTVGNGDSHRRAAACSGAPGSALAILPERGWALASVVGLGGTVQLERCTRRADRHCGGNRYRRPCGPMVRCGSPGWSCSWGQEEVLPGPPAVDRVCGRTAVRQLHI
ncbi:MAG: hypothetical protein H6744_14795 [Deltaproteobacteria bacterium]|nr:hypothetical protein [Deltaproteobacteria bacterium]